MVVVPSSGARTVNSRVCRHTFVSHRGGVTQYKYQFRGSGVNMNANTGTRTVVFIVTIMNKTDMMS